MVGKFIGLRFTKSRQTVATLDQQPRPSLYKLKGIHNPIHHSINTSIANSDPKGSEYENTKRYSIP